LARETQAVQLPCRQCFLSTFALYGGNPGTPTNFPTFILFAEYTLSRNYDYVATLCAKLADQGIQHASQLLNTSKMALQNRLISTPNGAFSHGEVVDVLELRHVTQKWALGARHGRSRSGGRNGQRVMGRGKGRKCGRLDDVREQSKPELWAAVEAGDHQNVKQLLIDNCDPEEKHLGWTPLMKAAEMNLSEIILLLLDASASVTGTNRKGRTDDVDHP
jgi:hypothetical protein